MKRFFIIFSVICSIFAMAMAWASDDNFKLKFKASTVDTRDGQRLLNTKNLEGGTTSDGKAFYIVQFDGPVLDEWKRALEATGVRFFSYIPENSFLVKLDPAAQSSIIFSPHVQYVGEYRPEYKISPGLNEDIKNRYASFATSATSDSVVSLSVKVFDREPLKPVIAAIEQMNGKAEVTTDGDGLNEKLLKVEIPFYRAARIAGLAEVEWVEPYPTVGLCNYASRVITNAQAAQTLGGQALPVRVLDGRGQVVGLIDSGLDIGSLTKIRASFGNMSTMHPAFSGKASNGLSKIAGIKSYRADNSWKDLAGHGTMVAGTMTGKLFDPLFPYQGFAPGARLFMQSGMSYADYLLFPDLNMVVFSAAYTAGVRAHNNSYYTMGSQPGEYNIQSVQVDTFAWKHKDFLPVFAAGNNAMDRANNYGDSLPSPDGVPDLGSISTPGTSKNALTVGASQSTTDTGSVYPYFRNFSGSPIIGQPLGGSGEENKVAAFSGRGPTQDGRIKPDIVAPGTNLITTITSQPVFFGYYGTGNNGTSFSAPMATGGAALVRQYYMDMRGLSPSASLLKATIINGATDIGGQVKGPFSSVTSLTPRLQPFSRPDFHQGWGRLDIMGAVYPGQTTGSPIFNNNTTPAVSVNKAGVYLAYVDNKSGITTGLGKSYRFRIKNPAFGTSTTVTPIPVKVTLVWNDYPSAAGAEKQLVNDLDLTVISPEGFFYNTKDIGFQDPNRPWYNDPGAGLYDNTNNVESVTFTTYYPGDFYVNVQGTNVPFGPQPYAIAVTGGLDLGDDHYISGTVKYLVGGVLKPYPTPVTIVATGPVLAYAISDPTTGYYKISGLTPGKYYLNVFDTLGGTLKSTVPNAAVTIGTSLTANKTGLILKVSP